MNYTKILIRLFLGLLIGLIISNTQLLSAQDKLVGMGIAGGGSVFAYDIKGDSIERWGDFSHPQYPYNMDILISSDVVFGATQSGGKNDGGVIYRMNLDGSGYKIIYHFVDSIAASPEGGLIEINDKLFGVVSEVNQYGRGAIYSINKDGSGFEILHVFLTEEGSSPVGKLHHSNNEIFGISTWGGDFNWGTIFKMNADGSDFKKIHDFDSVGGSYPHGQIIESNGKLWGTASQGGMANAGVLFSISKEGTNFMLEHSFGSTSLLYSRSTLLDINGTLWGTAHGGLYENGVVFKINNDGSGFAVIHDFDGSNGKAPRGRLIQSNNKIWGITDYGGINNSGVIFSLDFDGNNFLVEHEFDISSFSNITASGSFIWGMAMRGGSAKFGTVYNFQIVSKTFKTVIEFSNTLGSMPYGSLIEVGDDLFGMMNKGGDLGFGVIFKMDKDSAGYTKIHEFNELGGGFPNGSLLNTNGKLYGMTYSGGNSNSGVIFSINYDGSNFAILHHFDFYDVTNGGRPNGSLIELDGKLWGMTMVGGATGNGVIFSISYDGSAYKIAHNFESAWAPHGDLLESNGKLWGMTERGGSLFLGTIFSFNLQNEQFSIVHEFNGENGEYPTGSLVETDGKLWGLTSKGGTLDDGVIFNIGVDNNTFTKVFDFNGAIDGRRPYGSLIVLNNDLWGTTRRVSSGNTGIIFKLSISDLVFKKLLEFDKWVTGETFYNKLLPVCTTPNELVPDSNKLTDVVDECPITIANYPTATFSCSVTIEGKPNVVFPITTPGTTIVTWTFEGSNGSILEQNQNVILNQIDNSITQIDDALVLNAEGYTYQWIDCSTGLDIPMEINRKFIPNETGEYSAKISNNYCEVISECKQIIVLGIEDNKNINVSIYPSPTNDKLIINNNTSGEIIIELLNELGTVIKSVNSFDLIESLDVSEYSSGLYYLKVYDRNKHVVFRIIVN